MLILSFLFIQKRHHTQWQHVCDPHLLPHLISHQRETKKLPTLIILTIIWILSITVLAGPTWEKLPQPIYENKLSQVILLDMSENMYVQDLKPSRLERAKYKMIDLLRQSQETQVGLIAYTQQPFVVSPLTDDANTLLSIIPELNTSVMPVLGHNLPEALKQAKKLLKNNHATRGNILLFTANTANKAAINAAKQLKHEGYVLSVIGIGTTAGAPVPDLDGGFVKDDNNKIILNKLHPQALQRLAAAGGGRYITITNTDEDIKLLLDFESHQLKNLQRPLQKKIPLWKDQGYYFFPLLFPIILIGFRPGILDSLLG